MGLPSVNISFSEAAETVQERNNTGIVGLILKDSALETNPVIISGADEIPDTLSDENKEQLKLAIMGADQPPMKVIAYIVATAAADYKAALDYFDGVKIDYLAAPTCKTNNQIDAIKAWVIAARADNRTVKAVLPNTAADNFGIVNVTTAAFKNGGKTYTAEQYCSRIAGILASTPLTESATFKALPELDGCTKLTHSQMDEAINKGELIVFWDGEKVKIARGVNSYKTTTPKQGVQFKKIRIVQIMDTIQSDVRRIAGDTYIGRFQNTYQNKCLLLAAVGNYFASLEKQNILKVGKVDIDEAANKRYLMAKGVDVTGMTATEIREANTDDKVFLTATIKINDAIEDIILPITV